MLDRFQLVIRLSLLNAKEDLENLFVLVLHIDKSQFLSLVFTHEFQELTSCFDLVQTLDKLVRECFDPLNVLLFDLEECLANLSLPLLDDVDVWRVLADRFCHKLLDLLEILQLLLVRLVDVVQIFASDQTLQALVSVLFTIKEGCWRVVLRAVDAQSTVRELLLGVHQESLIDDVLVNVTFHIDGGFLFFSRVDKVRNDVECGRVIILGLGQFGRHALRDLKTLKRCLRAACRLRGSSLLICGAHYWLVYIFYYK